MALETILNMVKGKLTYLPVGSTIIPGINISVDDKLGNMITEQYYTLQKYTGLTDQAVEIESSYSALQKMLIAELVSYYGIDNKALTNIAGTNGEDADGGQKIKKGKADVVEAEFEYAKAKDGNFLGATTAEIKLNFARRACELAAQLGYNLYFCEILGLCNSTEEPAPFMYFEGGGSRRC